MTVDKHYFQNKTIIITGAGSGIGRALALALAPCDCNIVICDIDKGALSETNAALNGVKSSKTTVFVESFDVADRSAWSDSLARIHNQFDSIDVLINNAGIEGSSLPAWATTPQTLERVMSVNFYGMVNGSQLVLPYLAKSKQPALVNVSSVFGLIAVPNAADYCASKFAIRGYTEALRAELAQILPKIQVHLVHPGGIATNIARSDYSQAFKQKFLSTSPQALAERILNGVTRNHSRIVYGNQSSKLKWAARLFPLHWLNRLANNEIKQLNMTEAYTLEHPNLTLEESNQ